MVRPRPRRVVLTRPCTTKFLMSMARLGSLGLIQISVVILLSNFVFVCKEPKKYSCQQSHPMYDDCCKCKNKEADKKKEEEELEEELQDSCFKFVVSSCHTWPHDTSMVTLVTNAARLDVDLAYVAEKASAVSPISALNVVAVRKRRMLSEEATIGGELQMIGPNWKMINLA